MHLALKAYQELMNCVNAMDQSDDSAIRNSAKVIKSKETLLYGSLVLGHIKCSATATTVKF